VAVAATAVGLTACSSSTGSSATTAPSSGSSTTRAAGGGSGSGLDSVVRSISNSKDATFSATYKSVSGQNGQTVTFAQSPPKSAVVTPSGSFYVDGSSVVECQGSGSSATCTSLPSSLTGSLTGLTDLFSPITLTSTLKGLEAESHAAGFDVHTSSATYAGLPSTCITARGPSQPNAVTYCAARSTGILTYSDTGTSSVTLTAFSANPPASTFAPPPGATVQTVPSGA
jgi:hypothetical protein